MYNTPINLSVAETPEPDQNDLSEPRTSIAQSGVVLQSLKQSREKWLSAFPKFSSKSRSKNPGIVPTPHTSKRHGTCDIYIGPHVFYNTSIFEIRYTVSSVHVNSYRLPYPYSTTQASWNATNTYDHQPLHYTPSLTSEPAGNPLVTITPDLLSRVTRAGASNPTLANLLQLAASGYASQEQLRTLGLFIQSLAASPEEDYPPSSSSPNPYPTTAPNKPQGSYSYPPPPSSSNSKPPDLVLDFPEKQSVQFVFPRGVVCCERTESTTHASRHDVLLTTSLPFEDSVEVSHGISGTNPNNQPMASQVVTFRLANVTVPLWDFIQTWAGGQSTMEVNERILEKKRSNQPSRVFLQHRLPEGPLLTQIHSAAPLFATKLIKPTRSEPTVKRKRSKPSATRKQTTNEVTNSLPPAPAKRKKASTQSEQHGFVVNLETSVQISCHGCGQADVPLLQGGRYCRSCVDVGKADISNTSGHPPALHPSSLVR